ncbi:MAG: hypothetical protein KDE27_15950 [Planctomycetes bacterium]|nr:hypothetical protein [Planctomycetota bacterium]
MRLHPLLVLSTLVAAAAAQRVSETEPNGTSAQAQIVALGVQIDAHLTAGEQDWFGFTTTGGHVAIHSHAAIDVDTVFELFDGSGTNLLAVNDDTDGLFSMLSVNLAAGSYRLRVTGWGPTTAGDYHLEFGATATIAATGSESEPNDALAQADAIAGGDVLDASLSNAGDQDWYRLTLTAPRTGVWFEIVEGGTPWVSNHRWEIYDAGGGALGPTSTFGSNAGDSSPTAIRSSEVRSWPAGTYYLVVRHSSFPLGLGNAVAQGNYRLRVTTMPMGASPTVESEPNDTIQTADPVALGSGIAGSITGSGGADPSDIFGPFTISSPIVVQFQTMQGNANALLDSTIRLLDGNGDPVTQWTVGNLLSPTSHARATVNFARNETWYLEVRSPGTAVSQAGSYVLEIGASASPYVLAGYDIAEVNGLCLGSNGLRPTLAVDTPTERPVLGTTFSRRVKFLPPFAPFFLIEGLSDELALGSLPLPYDLGLNGAPDCYVHVDPVATALYLGNAGGSVELNSALPNSVMFRGIGIYEQAVVLDLPANTLGITSSSYARKLLGER